MRGHSRSLPLLPRISLLLVSISRHASMTATSSKVSHGNCRLHSSCIDQHASSMRTAYAAKVSSSLGMLSRHRCCDTANLVGAQVENRSPTLLQRTAATLSKEFTTIVLSRLSILGAMGHAKDRECQYGHLSDQLNDEDNVVKPTTRGRPNSTRQCERWLLSVLIAINTLLVFSTAAWLYMRSKCSKCICPAANMEENLRMLLTICATKHPN